MNIDKLSKKRYYISCNIENDKIIVVTIYLYIHEIDNKKTGFILLLY